MSSLGHIQQLEFANSNGMFLFEHRFIGQTNRWWMYKEFPHTINGESFGHSSGRYHFCRTLSSTTLSIHKSISSFACHRFSPQHIFYSKSLLSTKTKLRTKTTNTHQPKRISLFGTDVSSPTRCVMSWATELQSMCLNSTLFRFRPTSVCVVLLCRICLIYSFSRFAFTLVQMSGRDKFAGVSVSYSGCEFLCCCYSQMKRVLAGNLHHRA